MEGRKKRQLIIVNRRFQLRTAFSVIGFILIAYTIIIAAAGIINSYNNRNLSTTVTDLSEAIEKENAIVSDLLRHVNRDRKKSDTLDKNKIQISHGETMNLIQSKISILKRILDQNRVLIMVMILMGILLGVTLFFYLVDLTHRIAGPIHVLSGYMRDIMEGKEPDFRELRKNDEFKDFYEQFIEMAEKKICNTRPSDS